MGGADGQRFPLDNAFIIHSSPCLPLSLPLSFVRAQYSPVEKDTFSAPNLSTYGPHKRNYARDVDAFTINRIPPDLPVCEYQRSYSLNITASTGTEKILDTYQGRGHSVRELLVWQVPRNETRQVLALLNVRAIYHVPELNNSMTRMHKRAKKE